MTMEAGAEAQQGGETEISESDAQQIANLAQVHSYIPVNRNYPYQSTCLSHLMYF